MDYTARQLSDWCKHSIEALKNDPSFGSYKAVNERLAQLSGLSTSLLTHFRQGYRNNLSVDTLDRLADAIRRVQRRAA